VTASLLGTAALLLSALLPVLLSPLLFLVSAELAPFTALVLTLVLVVGMSCHDGPL